MDAPGARGIHGEALEALPSVFDFGLPALREGLARLPTLESAEHYTMAELMTKVEDTTALHRCGPPGLARLRRDGVRLKQLILQGGDYPSLLASLNDEYRDLRLTMGGVADCMALTFALHPLHCIERYDCRRPG
ncbi:MAG: hypothetical protein EHM13_03160 [Acidobacteria bacterium]|nr:MAG: hypothetical protein EHM13_03160 [Acidobacteriota bacterium]